MCVGRWPWLESSWRSMIGQSVHMLCQHHLLVAEDCLLPLPGGPHHLHISGCYKMYPLSQCHLPNTGSTSSVWFWYRYFKHSTKYFGMPKDIKTESSTWVQLRDSQKLYCSQWRSNTRSSCVQSVSHRSASCSWFGHVFRCLSSTLLVAFMLRTSIYYKKNCIFHDFGIMDLRTTEHFRSDPRTFFSNLRTFGLKNLRLMNLLTYEPSDL